MPNLIIEVTPEKLAELLRDLPAEQLKTVLAKVADRLEAREWMRLCESGFQEMISRFSASFQARLSQLTTPGSSYAATSPMSPKQA